MSSLTAPRISWKGVTYQTQARSVSLTYEAETVDDSVFGVGTRSAAGGLKAWNVDIEFIANESSNGGNTNDLFADMGSTGTLALRPTTNAISSTNPEYTGTALLTSMTPVDGSVGDLRVNAVSFQNAGALSRNES